MRIWLIFGVLFVLAAISVMAAPENRFNGGGYDGYGMCSTNNAAFLPPPQKGTVIKIY